MIIETKRFGKLEVEEKDIIEMAGGLPGIEDVTKYIILDHDEETPFKWFQAVEKPDLAFVVAEPFAFFAGYEFDLSDRDTKDLALGKSEDAAVLTILSVPEDPKKISVNLKAPLIINTENRKGKQVILTNEAYPVKFYLFKEENK